MIWSTVIIVVSGNGPYGELFERLLNGGAVIPDNFARDFDCRNQSLCCEGSDGSFSYPIETRSEGAFQPKPRVAIYCQCSSETVLGMAMVNV